MTERQKLIAYKQAVQAVKNKLKQMPGIKALGLVGLKENSEYFFFCGIWCRIRLLDLRLAVPSLWMHDGNTRGFLLAETDLNRMLEAGSDSRDEHHYLIDIWGYNEHGLLLKPEAMGE